MDTLDKTNKTRGLVREGDSILTPEPVISSYFRGC